MTKTIKPSQHDAYKLVQYIKVMDDDEFIVWYLNNIELNSTYFPTEIIMHELTWETKKYENTKDEFSRIKDNVNERYNLLQHLKKRHRDRDIDSKYNELLDIVLKSKKYFITNIKNDLISDISNKYKFDN